jgi:uncharacterized protein YqeY
MGLKENLKTDVIEAMREGDTQKRDTLRLLLAAIKQEEVDQRTDFDDAGVQAILTKQAKQRRESITDAKKAGRDDLATQEQAELEIIEPYLPKMMTDDEIRVLAEGVISETGASSMGNMGLVMGKLMPKVKGKADGQIVSSVVRDLLQS